MSTKNTAPAIPKNDKKIINGWAMFDWANSAYALVITSAIFPAYFGQVVDKNVTFLGLELTNTSLFTLSISLGYLLIALALPLLTGMADFSGRKMFFMKIFTTIGSISCLSLFCFTGMENLSLGVWGFVIAVIGFAGGQVFYNSYLPLIATADKLDSVSAKGFSYGYVGSVILLIINLAIIMNHEVLADLLNYDDLRGDSGKALATRLAFFSVGIWWIGFAQVSFARLPKDNPKPFSSEILGKGYQEIKKVYGELQFLPNTKKFLIAFFFYISGVLTVMMIATLFADQELGMPTEKLILTVLVIQLVAIFGALLFSKISGMYGNKRSIMAMLFIWISICIVAYFLEDQNKFYGLAAVVGLVMGGIQSLSRSTYAKLIPENTTDTASYFSFFDVVEKMAIMFGTLVFGYIDLITGGMRNSVLALIVFFVIGIGLLSMVHISPKRPVLK